MIGLMKRTAFALVGLWAALACQGWRGPEMKAEEFPLKTGAVHIYLLKNFEAGDSMVVTTIGTTRRDKLTVHIDSVAYFENDSLKSAIKTYYALTGSHLYYYGDEAVGFLSDPIPLVEFPLYEGRMWYEDPDDTLGPYRECIDYDTVWLEPGRYGAFCVEYSSSSGGTITRYWYASGTGLVKFGQSVPSGPSLSQELVAYYPSGIPEDTTAGR